MIELTVGIVVGLVVFSAILMPVIDGAQKNAGAEVTYTNGQQAVYHLAENDSVTFERTYASATGGFVTINGTTYSQTEIGAFGNLLMSDSITITQNAGGNQCNVYAKDVNTGTLFSGSASFTLTAADGEITIIVGDNTYTYAYTWLYYYAPDGEYSLMDSTNTTRYVKSINDYTASGLYASGENDCYYFVKNGEVTAEGYDATVDYTLTPVEGTTDIYTITLTINVDDESFSPYVVLVPLTVTGHADSGAIYDMLGVIPILIIAGLIVGIAATVISRRE